MACTAPARADGAIARPSRSLRGVGSFGAAHSNHDGADYTASVLKASGEPALASSVKPALTVY